MATSWTERIRTVTTFTPQRLNSGDIRIVENSDIRISEDGIFTRILNFLSWVNRIKP